MPYGHSLGGSIVPNHVRRRGPDVVAVVVTSPPLRTAFERPASQLTLGRLLYRVAPTMAMSDALRVFDLSCDTRVSAGHPADPLVCDRVTGCLALNMLAAGRWA